MLISIHTLGMVILPCMIAIYNLVHHNRIHNKLVFMGTSYAHRVGSHLSMRSFLLFTRCED